MASAKEPYNPLSLLDFQKRFPDEASCWSELVRIRWPKGKSCPKCRKPMGFVLTRRLFQCNACRIQVSATGGTIFHKSHLPLQKWFWAIYFMAISPKGVSMNNLKKHLGIRSYQSVWLMGHKIRGAMMQRDELYKLKGTVAVEDLLPKIEKAIVKGSTLKSDGSQSYASAKERGYQLDPVSKEPDKAKDHLKWIHWVSSNIKRGLVSTCHGCFPKYRKAYLAEFSYRFNRRYWPKQAFERLLFACILAKPTSLKNIQM